MVIQGELLGMMVLDAVEKHERFDSGAGERYVGKFHCKGRTGTCGVEVKLQQHYFTQYFGS
jgi:hypothetical protein